MKAALTDSQAAFADDSASAADDSTNAFAHDDNTTAPLDHWYRFNRDKDPILSPPAAAARPSRPGVSDSVAAFSDDEAPPPKSPEITEGPLGFINAAADTAGTAIRNIPYGIAHGTQDLFRRVFTPSQRDAPDNPYVDFLHVPFSENAQNFQQSVANVLHIPDTPTSPEAAKYNLDPFKIDPNQQAVRDFAGNYVVPPLTDVASMLPAAQIGKEAWARRAGPEIPTTLPERLPAQEVVNRASASQSMGAAATPLDISTASPELQSAVQDAGANLNPDVLERHIDAEKLPLPQGEEPLRLRRGQAARDPQQISDEKNLRADPDTQGILTNSIADQDRKLTLSMGEIRREATPDIVQKTNAEHGQAVVDAIKTADNNTVTDIRAKYKKLADANGGNMPIDTKGVVADVDAQLGKKFKTKSAAANTDISEVMDKLRSGEPMSFEEFENARSSLAEVQRGGGSDAVTAGVVRNALEKMPLSPEAKGLKSMADDARSAAAARFETIKRNPGYKAAIEDNVPKDSDGLHVIGAESPLADKFIDNYALGDKPNAATEYISRLKKAVPDIGPHLEAATLNKLRDAAGIDLHGNAKEFSIAGYRNANNALEAKRTTLLSPRSIENTQRLQRIGGYVKDELPGGSTNFSNTAATLGRFGAQFEQAPTVKGELASAGADLAVGHMASGPLGSAAVLGKRLALGAFKGSQEAARLQSVKNAKLNFAQDATRPGAGLTHPRQ